MSTEPPQISDLGRAVQDVGQKLELLVSDEIALAKTELAEKVSKLIKGAVFGIVAGVFALACSASSPPASSSAARHRRPRWRSRRAS